LGNLNAYGQEDPIQTLSANGYTNLVTYFGGAGVYSYVFDGQTGTLDYALANASLASQVTGATEWHINADEPDAFDYNLEFGRDAALFTADEFRSSDHDPVVIGLALEPSLLGDFDGNGVLNFADLIDLLRHLRCDISVCSEYDLIPDGSVNLNDVRYWLHLRWIAR
jgi:hypothetical protein